MCSRHKPLPHPLPTTLPLCILSPSPLFFFLAGLSSDCPLSSLCALHPLPKFSSHPRRVFVGRLPAELGARGAWSQLVTQCRSGRRCQVRMAVRHFISLQVRPRFDSSFFSPSNCSLRSGSSLKLPLRTDAHAHIFVGVRVCTYHGAPTVSICIFFVLQGRS